VFSSIDTQGRYAYGNQPAIAQWNLARLAEAMLPLIDPDPDAAVDLATDALARFAAEFGRRWLDGMRAKLGLTTEEEGDAGLASDLLTWMRDARADYTNTFRMLQTPSDVEAVAAADPVFRAWHERWLARLARQPRSAAEVLERMRRHNPAVIPRNHKVEEALDAATSRGDLDVMRRLLDVLATPYDHARDVSGFGAPVVPDTGYRTFCGT
jgi:uncharacterized protein YdiU (UPF0061 family)